MAQNAPGAPAPAPAAPGGAQPGVRVDPYRAYNFKLEIGGITEGHFTACSGLGVRVAAIKYREGGSKGSVLNVPGLAEYADITLSYGLTSSRQLWDWMMASVDGKVQRKNVSILLLDADGVTEVTRWDLVAAWPSAWHGAPLDTMAREVAIESLTLVFESLQRT
ncbi:MAG TPA: phage tail protein [Candidatus Dormibacteraeota bacterium]|nr:phage tail protein [Candidatus Dormibacteraeota bacterium]